MPTPLTFRQAEIYRWIFGETCRRGYQPSVREIADRFDIRSPNGLMTHLKSISRKGWIGPVAKGAQRARAIEFRFTPDGEPFAGFRPAVAEAVPT